MALRRPPVQPWHWDSARRRPRATSPPPELLRGAANAQEAIIAAIQEHVSALGLPAWPVYGLADEDERGWLSGGGESASGIAELRFSYRAPGEAERVTVHTQRRGSATLELARLLSWVQFGDDDDYPSGGEHRAWPPIETLTDTPHAGEAMLGGAMVPATVWRAETATVWRVPTGQVTVSVAVRGVQLTAPDLIEVTDLRPYQVRRAAMVSAYLAG